MQFSYFSSKFRFNSGVLIEIVYWRGIMAVNAVDRGKGYLKLEFIALRKFQSMLKAKCEIWCLRKGGPEEILADDESKKPTVYARPINWTYESALSPKA